MSLAAAFRDDIEVLPVDREPITIDQLRQLMRWSFGPDAVKLADLWQVFNDRLWGGRLEPCPIWLPRCTTYGRWIGLCTGDPATRRTLHLQVKYQLRPATRAAVLLHEQVHQALIETGQCSKHNAWPWCHEVMRITRELWGVEIWAAPAIPRRVDGRSQRVQRRGPAGQESITRQQIATWPCSIGLHVDVEQLLAEGSRGMPEEPLADGPRQIMVPARVEALPRESKCLRVVVHPVDGPLGNPHPTPRKPR